MPDFDAQPAAVISGNGIIARFPGVLCVASSSVPAALRTLLEIVRGAAGPAPGHVLARRLAAWLVSADAPAESFRFGTVAAAGENLAVFLLGGAKALVPDARVTMSGTESVAWADRLLPRPAAPLVLTMDGVALPPDPLGGVSDLRNGVVPGAAIVLLGTGVTGTENGAPVEVLATESRADAPSPAEEDHPPLLEAVPAVLSSGPELQGPLTIGDPAAKPGTPDPAAAPAERPDLTPPRRSEPILGSAPEEPPRPPLEAGAPAAVPGRPPPTDETEPDQAQAKGYLCSRGHLNDPRSHFCVLCGIRMNQRTGVPVVGPRPPLGLLVFDDGAIYTVDAEYLIGRMPEADDQVCSGTLRSIAIDDSSGLVSRVHAEVRLDGWDVLLVDSGSHNGTYLAVPGGQDWISVPPREPQRLAPGTRVRLGARMFTFESPSGVR
jgi:hypothetical protein